MRKPLTAVLSACQSAKLKAVGPKMSKAMRADAANWADTRYDNCAMDDAGDPSKPDEATRNLFAATYAQPGGMRAGFAQFTAFSQDAKDNKIFEQVKLTMPVLAVGGEKSFGPLQAVIMRHVATNVREAVVTGSGHWLMEERPAETVVLIRNFLDSPDAGQTATRLAD